VCADPRNGAFGAGPCPAKGLVGGCIPANVLPGYCYVEWYYMTDAAAARSTCEGVGGTWVDP
jgi:hypothetical protein